MFIYYKSRDRSYKPSIEARCWKQAYLKIGGWILTTASINYLVPIKRIRNSRDRYGQYCAEKRFIQVSKHWQSMIPKPNPCGQCSISKSMTHCRQANLAKEYQKRNYSILTGYRHECLHCISQFSHKLSIGKWNINAPICCVNAGRLYVRTH